eukprot:jgi/Psemu1/29195/gm1.29195_g
MSPKQPVMQPITQNPHPAHKHVFPHFCVPCNAITWDFTLAYRHFRHNSFQSTKQTSASIPQTPQPPYSHQRLFVPHSLLQDAFQYTHASPHTACHLSHCVHNRQTRTTWHCLPQRLTTVHNADPPQLTPHGHPILKPKDPTSHRQLHKLFPIHQTTTPAPPFCMSTGHLTYSSLPPPVTTAIDTAQNTYLKTLEDSPRNPSVCYILQTSSKIGFSYIDTRGTIQATHSLVPWTDPAGTSHLVGAHSGFIQAEPFNDDFRQCTCSARSYGDEALHVDKAVCQTRHTATTLFSLQRLTLPFATVPLPLCADMDQPPVVALPSFCLSLPPLRLARGHPPIHCHCSRPQTPPSLGAQRPSDSTYRVPNANSAFPSLTPLQPAKICDSKRQRRQSPTSEPTTTPLSDTSATKSPNTWDSSRDQARCQGLFVIKSSADCPCLNGPLGPRKACMCLNHCFITFFCPHTDAQCKFFHTTTWAQLSAAKKNVMAYVKANPAVEFSPSNSAHPTPAAPSWLGSTAHCSSTQHPARDSARANLPAKCTCPNFPIEPVTLYPGAKPTTLIQLSPAPKGPTNKHLLHSPGYCTAAWLYVFFPAWLYATLHAKYHHLDSTPVRGFASYCQLQMETSINKHSPLPPAHRLSAMSPPPKQISGTTTTTATLCKALIKDSRGGNTTLVERHLYLFIPNLHFTSLGIAAKSSTPPSKSPPTPLGLMIKPTRAANPRLHFWASLCASSSTCRSSASRSHVVPSSSWTTTSPVATWDLLPAIPLVAASALPIGTPFPRLTSKWHVAGGATNPPVAQAHLDSINCGIFEDGSNSIPDCTRICIPPAMPIQVDDLFTDDVMVTIQLTSATSIMSLQDIFDLDHPCQGRILS